jgi:hypothetical protein
MAPAVGGPPLPGVISPSTAAASTVPTTVAAASVSAHIFKRFMQ